MFEKRLAQHASEAISTLYGVHVEAEAVAIEKTKKEIAGDFTIVVFPFTRLSRKSPELTAGEIGSSLLNRLPEIESFQVIKGFLNLVLRDSFWIELLKFRSDQAFGTTPVRNEPAVVLEYSSPNTNKPLHLGHIRNNLLGFSIAEILKANGRPVVRVNLVNDRGIHICKSMLAYKRLAQGETPESAGIKGDHLIGKYYVLFNDLFKEEVKDLMQKGLSEEEASKQAPVLLEAQDILRRWEAGDSEVLSLWRTMNGWAYDGFDVTYKKLGVAFDKVYYESETYLLGKALVEEGVEAGQLIRRADGSVWADLTSEGLDEKLLLRSDGTSVYMTQDLGTADLRYRDFTPSEMVYVVGNEQNYHFDVLKKILARLGKSYASRIHHLSYGMVELPQGKMKSREGTVVDADDLISEMVETARLTTMELGKTEDFTSDEAEALYRNIGLGALKYFILKVDPKKNMLFDPAESIDFNGNTGPFIQYSYARIKTLLRKASAQGWDNCNLVMDAEIVLHERERDILRNLAQFPDLLKQSAREMSPALVANYVFELAREYNQFYQEVPVLKEPEDARRALRLALSEMTGNVIKVSLGLLGIEVSERM